MKVSVTFLLVAFSCYFSPSPAFLQTGSPSQLSEHDAYCYTRTVTVVMEQYQEVQTCTGEDKEFRTKCTLNHIINVVKELCVETGWQPLDVLQRMGLPKHLVQELHEIIQSGGSVHDLDNKKCEDLLGSMVKGLGPLLNDVLGPLLGALKDILGTATKLLDSLTGGALGGVTGALGGVLDGVTGALGGTLNGVTGGLGGALGGVTGAVGGVLDGATGLLGGVLNGVTGGLGGALGGAHGAVGGALGGVTGAVGGVAKGVTGAVGGVLSGITGGLGGILGGGGKHGESKGKGGRGFLGLG